MKNPNLSFLVVLWLAATSFPHLASAEAIPGASCKGTLEGGAVSGPFTCYMIAGYGFSPGVGAVSFTPVSVPTMVNNLTAAFSLKGPPAVGKVSEKDCTDCSAVVVLNDGASYEMSKKDALGTILMDLTDASALFPSPQGTMYSVTGTIEADLYQTKPNPSADKIHMKVTF